MGRGGRRGSIGLRAQRGKRRERPRAVGLLAVSAAIACVALLAGSTALAAANKTGPSRSAMAAMRSQRRLKQPTAPRHKKLPKISGILEDGQVLSVGTGSWKGTGPLSFSYEWEACSGSACVPIPGATAATYRLSSEQIGGSVRAVVTASNSVGSARATSRATKMIQPGPPVELAAPGTSGALQEGSTLAATPGAWAGTAPVDFSYQWQRCSPAGGCEDIPEATSSTYTLAAADLASSIDVVVTASNAEGSASATSPETTPVLAVLPAETELPAISGSLEDGALLSASPGTWTGTAPINFAYQWQRCSLLGGGCENIPGATGSTYRLQVADVASSIDVVVTATNARGSASATSPETQPVQALLPSNTELPTITGLLKDGQLLSATTGTWTGTPPLAFKYQWQLCNPTGEDCKNLAEAIEPTLKLTPTDVGDTLRVIITATNTAGSTQAASTPTSLIQALLPSNTELPTITGLLKDGQLLDVSSGTWTGTPPITYSYQWQLCTPLLIESCGNISGATGSSLQLTLGDVGLALRVKVTATNSAGSESVYTSLTSTILGLL